MMDSQKKLKAIYEELLKSSEADISEVLSLGADFHPSLLRAVNGYLKNKNEKSLSTLLTAFERELKVSVTDSDILVTTQDDPPELKSEFPIVFLLDNIRSAFNIGSILRLANAIRAQEVILCGYTASPEHPAVKKSALGAEAQIKISELPSLEEAIHQLKNKGYQIVALETAKPSVSLFDWKTEKKPVALWIGNERFGIASEKLNLATSVLRIPMFGSKNSLNVAQALSVVSYEWLRQYNS